LNDGANPPKVGASSGTSFMPHTEVSPSAAGLDIGSRRFLHPGPLRWLRSLGWAVLLFVVFMVVYAFASKVGEPAKGASGTPLSVLWSRRSAPWAWRSMRASSGWLKRDGPANWP
jgi:hypothetical protein